jgi:hypothetical protein
MHSYHARLLLHLARAVILPSLVFSSSLGFIGYPPILLAALLHLVFIVFCAYVRAFYLNIVNRSEANNLGATPIPCVVGKWPGNLDILLRMMRAFDSSYVLDVYLDLFEEYQCTTLNLRVLWADHVSNPFSIESL